MDTNKEIKNEKKSNELEAEQFALMNTPKKKQTNKNRSFNNNHPEDDGLNEEDPELIQANLKALKGAQIKIYDNKYPEFIPNSDSPVSKKSADLLLNDQNSNNENISSNSSNYSDKKFNETNLDVMVVSKNKQNPTHPYVTKTFHSIKELDRKQFDSGSMNLNSNKLSNDHADLRYNKISTKKFEENDDENNSKDDVFVSQQSMNIKSQENVNDINLIKRDSFKNDLIEKLNEKLPSYEALARNSLKSASEANNLNRKGTEMTTTSIKDLNAKA